MTGMCYSSGKVYPRVGGGTRPRCTASTVLQFCINDALTCWWRPHPFNDKRCNRPARWRARRTWRRRRQRDQQVAGVNRYRSAPRGRYAYAIPRSYPRLYAPVGVGNGYAPVGAFSSDGIARPPTPRIAPLVVIGFDSLPTVAVRHLPHPINCEWAARRSGVVGRQTWYSIRWRRWWRW